jgi:hypothetical protein
MSRFLSFCVTFLAALSAAHRLDAFSLLGPYADWQTVEIGYNYNAENGGPRVRGEEYRLSTPIMTYGIDSSFIEFFGTNGIRAIDQAFETLNAVGPVSEFSPDLAEFPLRSTRFNALAAQLNLFDLKTTAMAFLMEQLGIAIPERYCWSIRARRAIPNTNPQQYEFSVNLRNFDPVTLSPTPFINGTLYTYSVVPIRADPTHDSIEISLDAAIPNITAAAHAVRVLTDNRVRSMTGYGSYLTGLTRDDAGALRYLYSRDNWNVESAPPGSFSSGFSGGSTGGQGGFVPWVGYIPSTATNAGAGGGGDGGAGGGVATNGIIIAGARQGVDQVQFVRVNLDPILRVTPQPVLVTYTETVRTNGLVRNQRVTRVLNVPDILIGSADLGVVPDTVIPVFFSRSINFLNNSSTGTVNGAPTAEGPGNIESTAGAGGLSISMQFNKIGPFNYNGTTIPRQEDGIQGFLYGSYDGSTNSPVIYPEGTTLGEAADVVLGGN